jgi:hypothetical protein
MLWVIFKKSTALQEAKNNKPIGVRNCKDSLKAVLIVDQAIIEQPANIYALV